MCFFIYPPITSIMKSLRTLSLLGALLIGQGLFAPATHAQSELSDWGYAKGKLDEQGRLQGQGTAFWRQGGYPSFGFAVTGNFVNGVPHGKGQLAGLKKVRTGYTQGVGTIYGWEVDKDGGIVIPNLEFDQGQIVPRQLQLSALNEYGRMTQQLNAKISTDDVFRLAGREHQGILEADLGELSLTTNWASGDYLRKEGMREASVEITGRFRTGQITPNKLIFDINGELQTTGSNRGFVYKGDMRVSCWQAHCEIIFKGPR
jgi:hypothetical protein